MILRRFATEIQNNKKVFLLCFFKTPFIWEWKNEKKNIGQCAIFFVRMAFMVTHNVSIEKSGIFKELEHLH